MRSQQNVTFHRNVSPPHEAFLRNADKGKPRFVLPSDPSLRDETSENNMFPIPQKLLHTLDLVNKRNWEDKSLKFRSENPVYPVYLVKKFNFALVLCIFVNF